MNKITFDKLKQNCVTEFCYRNTRGGAGYPNGGVRADLMGLAVLIDFKQTGKAKKSHVLAREIEDDCVKAIERTDVRNLKPLIDLCPEAVPEWIKRGNYVLDLGDNGWTFLKAG